MGMQLTNEEIRAVLRAADEIIGQGGRTLLAKILKGSRDKKSVGAQSGSLSDLWLLSSADT
ncbi:hypothetical protein [Paenibacillus elgii]|uniref:hypothetical protein n=1 Tax=Paenibacillus elgii TaxID=189691 RepID=UPI000682FA1F|nr:hypothetical protein [Paenibacillus elgii]